MNKPKEFVFLHDAFKSLPGVGTKSANRFIHHILNQDSVYQKEFIKRILDLTNTVKKCDYCHNLATDQYCEICRSFSRTKQLCIVSSIEDLERIEESGNYQGYYNVIGNNIDLRKFKLNSIDLNSIQKQVNDLDITDIIIATSFSIIGEAISEYLQANLKLATKVGIYRLGFGIPLNANIDYIDDETIRESFLNKKKII